ncbi:MAG: hypothetical protein QG594_178 [Bacteroidota bacterium]|nr:hypothetical protein [Bacteroidota bacterium]
MKNIEEFIDRIIAEKGFDVKDPEVLAQIKTDLTSRFEDRLNAMIISNLPGDKLEEFNTLLDTNNEEEVNTFLKNNIPEIEEKLAAEMLEFKSIYLG